ncbi:MAG: LysM peptidoglycan-binding domain-containing protein [Phycisphaerales bacterium]|nr:LysM peptidoglycan-binding domain-containing protein [Phycisphaerales bacterium]
MDAFRVVGLASYAPPEEQGRTTVTRELKLALIVGFSLVLFVTVLVSDHLSRARRAELPRIAEPASSLTSIPPSAEIKPASDRTPALKDPPAARPTPLPGDPGSPFGPAPSPAIAGASPSTSPQTSPDGKVALGPMVTPVERGILPPDGAHLDNPLVISQTPGQPGSRPSSPAQIASGDTAATTILPTTTPPAIVEPPAAPKVTEYTIEEGDTLYELSLRFYKDARHWKALQAYNRDRLTKDGQPRAGGRILVPTLDTLLGRPATQVAKADLPALVDPKPVRKSGEAAKPSRPAVYKVQKNDTMIAIAQRILGSQKRVNDLIKANPGVDPENMKVGTELRIPA